MADSTPKQQLDLEDLALHEGATVLLRRALGQLCAGDWCEVRGDSAQLAEQLAAWCRKEGHHCEPALGVAGVWRIQSAGLAPLIATSRTQIAETADPAWGLAPRGASVESGGPDFGFTLREKREVWARELNTIYGQATANQWSLGRDVPWEKLPQAARGGRTRGRPNHDLSHGE